MSSEEESFQQGFEFPEPISAPNFPQIEAEVRSFWDDHSIYQQSLKAREGAEKYERGTSTRHRTPKNYL